MPTERLIMQARDVVGDVYIQHAQRQHYSDGALAASTRRLAYYYMVQQAHPLGFKAQVRIAMDYNAAEVNILAEWS
jgi:hypothetical protein